MVNRIISGRNPPLYCARMSVNRYVDKPKQRQKHTMDLVLSYYVVLGLGSGLGGWDRVQVLTNRSLV